MSNDTPVSDKPNCCGATNSIPMAIVAMIVSRGAPFQVTL